MTPNPITLHHVTLELFRVV